MYTLSDQAAPLQALSHQPHSHDVGPRQNRVDPWSRLVANPARGLWMGNRGSLHNAGGQIVRHHQGTRWIICLLDFRGRKRALMQPGRYTELFFLDEATALAAGHRPCAECQHARYKLFLDFWAATHGELRSGMSVKAVDTTLHAARWANGQKVTYAARLNELPTGTMVTALNTGLDEQTPYLTWRESLWRWDFTGYAPGPEWQASREVRVLTPKPVVAILAAGYPVHLHPTLESGISA